MPSYHRPSGGDQDQEVAFGFARKGYQDGSRVSKAAKYLPDSRASSKRAPVQPREEKEDSPVPAPAGPASVAASYPECEPQQFGSHRAFPQPDAPTFHPHPAVYNQPSDSPPPQRSRPFQPRTRGGFGASGVTPRKRAQTMGPKTRPPTPPDERPSFTVDRAESPLGPTPLPFASQPPPRTTQFRHERNRNNQPPIHPRPLSQPFPTGAYAADDELSDSLPSGQPQLQQRDTDMLMFDSMLQSFRSTKVELEALKTENGKLRAHVTQLREAYDQEATLLRSQLQTAEETAVEAVKSRKENEGRMTESLRRVVAKVQQSTAEKEGQLAVLAEHKRANDESYQSLTAGYADLKVQTDAIRAGMQTAEERMAGLRRLLEDVKVESAKEGEASKELTSELEEVKISLAAEATKNAELLSVHEVLSLAFGGSPDAFQKQLSELLGSGTASTALVGQLASENERRREELDEARITIAEKEQALEELRKKLVDALDAHSELQKDLRLRTEQLKELAVEKNSAETVVESMGKEAAADKAALAQAEVKLQELEMARKQWQAREAEYVEQHTIIKASLATSTEHLEGERKKLEGKLDGLHQEVQKWKDQMQGSLQAQKVAEARAEEKQRTIDTLETNLAAERARVQELIGELKETRVQVQELSGNLKESQTALRQLQKKEEGGSRKSEESKKKISELQAQVKEKEAEVKQTSSRLEEKERLLEESEGIHNSLGEDLRAKDELLKAAAEEKARLVDQIDVLESEKVELKAKLDEIIVAGTPLERYRKNRMTPDDRAFADVLQADIQLQLHERENTIVELQKKLKKLDPTAATRPGAPRTVPKAVSEKQPVKSALKQAPKPPAVEETQRPPPAVEETVESPLSDVTLAGDEPPTEARAEKERPSKTPSSSKVSSSSKTSSTAKDSTSSKTDSPQKGKTSKRAAMKGREEFGPAKRSRRY